MSSNKFTDRIDRRVIPRWRVSTEVAVSGELTPLRERAPTVSFDRELARLKREILLNPTPGVAADALGVALLSGDNALEVQAKDILNKHQDIIPAGLRKLIGSQDEVIEGATLSRWDCSTKRNQVAIQRIRRLLLQYQHNPLLYLDMARNQAVLGLREKAEKSIRVALSLAPQHRHVLRAASRFYISEDAPEIALRLLVNSPMTRHDPWLMAAEVATAQVVGRGSKFFKQGKLLLDHPTFKPVHLSELAAAIGTVELEDGRRKDAKRRFEIAMLDPTENALAQVKWAEDKSNSRFAFGNPTHHLLGAHEAAFIKAYYQNHDIVEAARHVDKWFDDEPFSAVAAMMHSYMGSILDDYQSVIDVCDLGLRSNPNHPCLMNNKIFAQISSGQVFEGDEETVLAKLASITKYLSAEASKEDADVAHIGANIGLLLYRSGYPEKGRQAYDHAVKWATRKNERFSAANALMFHAREAILAKTEWAGDLMREAESTSLNSSGQAFYMTKLRALAANPEKAGEILNPVAAMAYLPKKLAPKLGIDFKIEKNDDGTVTLIVPKRLRPQRQRN